MSKELIESLPKIGPELTKLLPKSITPEKFIRIALTEFRSNPKLMSCTKESIFACLYQIAELGLDVGKAKGHIYLIPYNNKRTGQLECTFQLGYKGIIQLALRSDRVSFIDSAVVYNNDLFEVIRGTENNLKHVQAFTDRGDTICIYAIIHYRDGSSKFEIMTIQEIQEIRKMAMSDKFWSKNFNEMGKKTVIKKLLKYEKIDDNLTKILESEYKQMQIEKDSNESKTLRITSI